VVLPLRAIVAKDVVVSNFPISAHSSLCLRVAAFTSKTTMLINVSKVEESRHSLWLLSSTSSDVRNRRLGT
jgi:hypothetical protein